MLKLVVERCLGSCFFTSGGQLKQSLHSPGPEQFAKIQFSPLGQTGALWGWGRKGIPALKAAREGETLAALPCGHQVLLWGCREGKRGGRRRGLGAPALALSCCPSSGRSQARGLPGLQHRGNPGRAGSSLRPSHGTSLAVGHPLFQSVRLTKMPPAPLRF